MVMRKHQRYFPVYTGSGEELLPYFITVANGPIHPATVIAGKSCPHALCCCIVSPKATQMPLLEGLFASEVLRV